MEVKDKAKELVDKFTVVGLQQRSEGIACALIAVEEIIENEKIDNLEDNNLSYWQEVKQEIEKL